MKFLFFFILFLTSCANPTDPTKSNIPLYSSSTAVISGAETPCESCLLLEVQNSVVRVNFSSNPLEECAGKNSMVYQSSSNLTLPQSSGNTTWQGQINDSSSVEEPCLPEYLNLEIYWISTSPNEYELNYNGKIYKIRKIN